MLLEHLPHLANKRILLASASPRRAELLHQIGLKFEVRPSTFEETLRKDAFATAALYAIETATHKALEVASASMASGQPADLVIGADTIVEHDKLILEKPADAADAVRMLTRMSGQSHQVHTGVALVLPHASDPKHGKPPLVRSFAVSTEVEFDQLTPDGIQAYVDSGEPFGKAGAYGIQGKAAVFVKRLSGDYFNVMGFPLHAFAAEVAGLVDEGLL
ncbi:hypothetical protein WJX72_001514 [[Myrmecia] bisecta]|uniref:Uncharacterized protein n=1 Tax=[Myrmecia] bisecta TaxID=41462 RepID=A0AAW1PZF0_9CHLO